MYGIKLIVSIIIWTSTIIFVCAAFFTLLSLVGWVKFVNPEQQDKLFNVIIVSGIIPVGCTLFRTFMRQAADACKHDKNILADKVTNTDKDHTSREDTDVVAIDPVALNEKLQIYGEFVNDNMAIKLSNISQKSFETVFEIIITSSSFNEVIAALAGKSKASKKLLSGMDLKRINYFRKKMKLETLEEVFYV